MLKPCLSSLLKRDTQAYHQQLDNQERLRVLLRKDISALQYETAVLHSKHCHAICQPIYEQAYQQFSAPGFARIDCKLPALQHETAEFQHQLKLSTDLPPPALESLEDYLGHSYVMTGSKLGARYILKNLQAAAHLSGHYHFEYFKALTEESDILGSWETWKAQLDAFAEQRALDKQKIINAATGCFCYLIDWFSQQYTLLQASPAAVHRI